MTALRWAARSRTSSLRAAISAGVSASGAVGWIVGSFCMSPSFPRCSLGRHLPGTSRMNLKEVYCVGLAGPSLGGSCGRGKLAPFSDPPNAGLMGAAHFFHARVAGGRDRRAPVEHRVSRSWCGIGVGAGDECDEDLRAAPGCAGGTGGDGGTAGREDAGGEVRGPGAAGPPDV